MTKFYFREGNDERCFSKENHIDFMKENELQELQLYEAERYPYTDIFYCKHFDQVGEKGECGKSCKSYSPRNKIKGICIHQGNCYTKSDKSITINL